jgi:hypothetical protein
MTAVISQSRTSVTAPLAWYVPPSRPSAAPPPTVMYRRRRLMVVVVATVVVLAAAVALGRQVGSGEAPASPPGAVPSASAPLAATTGAAVYVVQPGDTVWGVARRLYPTLDQTAAVARLVGANGRSPLRIGQHLVVPPAS